MRARSLISPSLVLILALAIPTSSVAGDAGGGRRHCLESPLQTLLSNSARAAHVRPLDSIQELKLMTYNVLNLRQNVGRYEYLPDGSYRQVLPPEPIDAIQTEGIARVIREENPDAILFQEIEGGLDTLEKFNQDFLKQSYSPYLIGGNDERGIHIGIMLKKDLPLSVELQTHRDLTWIDPLAQEKGPRPVFSRDIPAVLLRTEKQSQDSQPLLILLGNHGKSKRPRPGDPDSVRLRSAQYEAAAGIINGYKEKFGKNTRIVLGGDFNTSIDSPELAPLYRGAGMKEAFTLLDNPPPVSERVTHTFHPRDGPTDYNQIDGFLLSPGIQDEVKNVRVYRYKDANGKELPIPSTYEARGKNPSDHFPVVMTLDFQSALKKLQSELEPKP